jgi:hypothetical protein
MNKLKKILYNYYHGFYIKFFSDEDLWFTTITYIGNVGKIANKFSKKSCEISRVQYTNAANVLRYI